jgi:hypothetical protein
VCLAQGFLIKTVLKLCFWCVTDSLTTGLLSVNEVRNVCLFFRFTVFLAMTVSVTYIVKGGTQGAIGSGTALQAGRSTV